MGRVTVNGVSPCDSFSWVDANKISVVLGTFYRGVGIAHNQGLLMSFQRRSRHTNRHEASKNRTTVEELVWATNLSCTHPDHQTARQSRRYWD
jgi:hypothetical protein